MSDDRKSIVTAAAFTGLGVGAAARVWLENGATTPAQRDLAQLASIALPLLGAWAAHTQDAPNVRNGFLAAAGAAFGGVFLAPQVQTLNPTTVTTIYGAPSGMHLAIEAQAPLLTLLQPGGIQIHTIYEDFLHHGAQYVARLRGLCPNAEIWFGIAADYHITQVQNGTMTVPDLQRLRASMTSLATSLRVPVVVWDCEAAWKHNIAGFDAIAAEGMIQMAREAGPNVTQFLTSYPQPTLHATFPWKGFWLVDGHIPQVYWNGLDDGGAAYRGFVHSWTVAIAQQWIRPGTRMAGYLRVHGSSAAAISQIANAFAEVCYWYLGGGDEGVDVEGKRALVGLTRIDQLGFRGAGRIQTFQASRGLIASGRLDQATLAALGLQ